MYQELLVNLVKLTIYKIQVYIFRGLNPIDPILDIHALNKLNDVDISIVIGGTLNYPRINLHSTPILSQKIFYLIWFLELNFHLIHKIIQSKQSQNFTIFVKWVIKRLCKRVRTWYVFSIWPKNPIYRNPCR